MTDSSKFSKVSVGTTSSSLLERVKAREDEAWRRLERLYSPMVMSWCRRAGVAKGDRVDLLQEVFRAVAVAIDDFRHDQPGDTFRGWLRIIAHNKIVDHFRWQNRQPVAMGGSTAQERIQAIPDGDASSLSLTNEQERTILVRQALKLLHAEFEERTWQAFWQATVDGYPTDVVAQSLQMSPAAVRQAKSRVLRRLRDQLNELFEDDCRPEELGGCKDKKDKEL